MEQARDSMINMDGADFSNLQGEFMGEGVGDVQTYEYDDFGAEQRQNSNQYYEQQVIAATTQVEKVDNDTQTSTQVDTMYTQTDGVDTRVGMTQTPKVEYEEQDCQTEDVQTVSKAV